MLKFGFVLSPSKRYKNLAPLFFFFEALILFATGSLQPELSFPLILRGTWYSWEYGHNTQITIAKQSIGLWGTPLFHFYNRHDIHEYVLQQSSGCYSCSRFIVRSWNIVERIDSSCISINLTKDDYGSLEQDGCRHIFNLRSRGEVSPNAFPKSLPRRGHMMYREDASSVSCRHSIYGSFRFAYLIKDSFTGECQTYKSRLHSCDRPGTQFLISNQKFFLEFSKCDGIKNSFDGSGEFICLGEWREGLQHYFVAANLRESRKEERFRCFLKNREDPYYLGMSRSPSCQFLTTPDNSPIRIRLEPLREMVEPSCFFPANISGSWTSSGQGEPQVQINATHIVESRWIGHQLKRDINVCIQNKGKRFLMAKISEFGCQTEYVCLELLPRHHNIVRFRMSQSLIHNTFDVCDYGNFKSNRHWKYDTLINDEPKLVECPFSGRFTFGQKGSAPLQSRILTGITRSPLDTYHCSDRQTDLSICDSERKQIVIDLDHCLSLNVDGHPIEIKSIPDYHLNCIGFWKENLNSYLVTHDPSDSVSRFRCWVYQRVSPTELWLSQGLGSACGLRQVYSSSTVSDGATLALNLTLRERLYDHCPMYYDDGSNPWKPTTSTLRIFSFRSLANNLPVQLPFLVVSVFFTSLCFFTSSFSFLF